MRVLFWGTPVFAVPSLRALDDEGFDIVGVVTQPDRRAGRGRKMRASAVKEVALELGFPCLTPELPRGEAFMDEIRALEPEISVVIAYGHILKPEVLDVPPHGSINVHASLLPKLRGAAPIHWAIARGHAHTGVTIMRMAEGMDSGAIIHQIKEPILPDQTCGELSMRLSELGAEALIEALALLGSGVANEVEQEHDSATFAPKVDRAIARIDWTRPAEAVALHVRAMDPAPGAWTELDGHAVKLFRPRPIDGANASLSDPSGAEDGGDPPLPGRVLPSPAAFGIVVATGSGSVAFEEVQPPGKRRMRSEDWINGRGIRAGQTLG